MSKIKFCLAMLLPALAACATPPKPVMQRNDTGEELNAVRARAVAADRSLDTETKAPRPAPAR